MRYFILFLCVCICFMSANLLSKQHNFFTAFDDLTGIFKNVGDVIDGPYELVLEFLGLYESDGNHQYSCDFYMRSTADNKIIPKDYKYYDSLYYLVILAPENHLRRTSWSYYLHSDPMWTSYSDVPRDESLYMYFDVSGNFLFATDRYHHINLRDGSIYSYEYIHTWNDVYSSIHLDYDNFTLYVKPAWNTYSATFKFSASQFYYGIWRQ